MKPYLSDKRQGTPKFEATPERATGISKLGKMIAKNANRSLKKTARQYDKLLIKHEVEEIEVAKIEEKQISVDNNPEYYEYLESKGLISNKEPKIENTEEEIADNGLSKEFKHLIENHDEQE